MVELMGWLVRAIALKRWGRSLVRGLSVLIVLVASAPAIASVPLFEVAAGSRAVVNESQNSAEEPPLPFSDPGDLFFGVKAPQTKAPQTTAAKEAPIPMPRPVTEKTLGQRVASAAIAAEGTDVTMGPGRGSVACAWAVNRFGLRPVLGKNVGKNPNLVMSVQRD
ncbi:MAG: hypothetical protein AAGF75_08605, partial [Cyanobacteria bacterium P01_H01_bin.130]